jgi:hypothetical protein
MKRANGHSGLGTLPADDASNGCDAAARKTASGRRRSCAMVRRAGKTFVAR